ncbi:hypothetical protein [Ichthyenterobacterium magnum]|uniref:Outer membrane protein with beta-barrel domain n=1 Tax=Ichthyenterobacterium magnum TaxID=1230530 RepID=A0A420DFM9_9FLAO|nr:hypothetical protein [Ichthyenterobacterium magnum]RKE90839.1 hypothetical protein BXY80_2682 [Ichthyenterobacterium magnum]
MTKKITLILAVIFSITANSQSNYEKGYLIDTNNKKVECLIKNEDWKNNPDTFTYKINESSEDLKGDLSTIIEFGFNNIRYKRFLVKIDISSTQTNQLSKKKEPNLIEKNLFLKYLVEGKSNLFSYCDDNAKLYFYNLNDSNPNQLIYKKYYVAATQYKENTDYKQQLWNNLKCDNLSLNDVKKLNYKSKDLITYFIDYNTCDDSNYINSFKNEKKSGNFNLSIKPSINFSSLSTKNDFDNRGELDFGSKTNIGFGIELEYVLPFNNNRLSLILEPTFKNYSSEINDFIYINTPVLTETSSAKIDYKAIDILFGIKYYIPINDFSKIYLSALYNFNSIDLSSSFDFSATGLVDLGIKPHNYIALSIGFKFNDKFSLEARFSPNQTIIANSLWENKYPRTSFIFGYNLF